ncbi:uncharacterized protein C9orf40 homolog [Rhinatrema bivittatum]|uniref:uncharacterized protein C9orf40 homolog n=1 Tax=Rhinatrema bivittatum TaxID=194408 RepID=UPI00112A1D28|nr:uncharacterized protein C9orf40 homolog [Rhinatrema bivittatum]
MHAPQPAVPVRGQQQQQREPRSAPCRTKRKAAAAAAPPAPCKRFLPEQQHGEGEHGSGAAPATGKRKQETEPLAPGGPKGSPGREKKRQRREAPREQQLEEDFGQFSSFQYWRTPLPKLDLSDLLGLDGDSMAEDTASSSAEGVEMAMES